MHAVSFSIAADNQRRQTSNRPSWRGHPWEVATPAISGDVILADEIRCLADHQVASEDHNLALLFNGMRPNTLNARVIGVGRSRGPTERK